MNITSKIDSGFQILTVGETRVDAAAAIQFKDRVKDLTKDSDLPVILDLANVEFVDSSGLGAIVAAKKHLAPERQLHLAGLAPIVAKVFALTRMDKVFQIHEKADDALAGAGKNNKSA